MEAEAGLQLPLEMDIRLAGVSLNFFMTWELLQQEAVL